jgi:hypothetical protein
MQNFTYQDLTRGCLQTAEKLYRAATGDTSGRWQLELGGQTAGIYFKDQSWRLQLPALPLDARLTPQERDHWAGYTIHETGHACFTRFDVWNKAVSEGLQDLVNGLEDVRIERKLIDMGVAANARALLEGLTDFMVRKSVNNGFDPHNPAREHLSFALALYGRINVNGYDVPSAPAVNAKTARGWAWIWRELETCQSTLDVLRLARKIRKKQDAADASKQEPGKQDAADGQDASKQETGGQDAADGQDAQQDASGAGAGENKQDDAQQGQQAQEDKPDGAGGAGASREGGFGLKSLEPSLDDLADAIRQRGKPQTQEEELVDRWLGTLPRAKQGDWKPAPGNDANLKDLETLYPSLAKLKADITRLVKSPDRIGVTRGLSSGVLDRRAFSRIATGARDVFARRAYAEGVNAAVSIVLDGSSSMHKDQKLKFSNAMALAMGDALDRAAVPFEVLIAGIGYQLLAVDTVKPFNETWRKRRSGLARLETFGGTCNLLGATVAVDRLLAQRDATRRILFVLSDGDDNWPAPVWRRAIDLWARKGVETVGVGLMYDVREAFPDCVTIRSPEDLAREGLGIVARRLKSA